MHPHIPLQRICWLGSTCMQIYCCGKSLQYTVTSNINQCKYSLTTAAPFPSLTEVHLYHLDDLSLEHWEKGYLLKAKQKLRGKHYSPILESRCFVRFTKLARILVAIMHQTRACQMSCSYISDRSKYGYLYVNTGENTNFISQAEIAISFPLWVRIAGVFSVFSSASPKHFPS